MRVEGGLPGSDAAAKAASKKAERMALAQKAHSELLEAEEAQAKAKHEAETALFINGIATYDEAEIRALLMEEVQPLCLSTSFFQPASQRAWVY